MNRILLFIALSASLMAQTYQATNVALAGGQSAIVGTTANATNTNGSNLFLWYSQTLAANYINYPAPTTPPESSGALSGVESLYARCYPDTSTVQILANSFDSNNLWLNTPNVTGFPSATWFNNTNSPRWGYTTGEGFYTFDYMYNGTFAGGRLVAELDTKCVAVAALDDNFAMVVYTKLIGGSSLPGFGTAVGSDIDVPMVSPAAGSKVTLVRRWNNIPVNSAGIRTGLLYVLESGGTIRSAGWSTAVTAPQKGFVWHRIGTPNDTDLALESYFAGPGTGFSIGGEWAFDLPVSLWADSEFTGTIDATSLQGQDHASGVTWRVIDTPNSRWATSTSAQITSPSTINLWTDNGTRGFRCDMTVTTAGMFGWTFSAVEQVTVGGLMTTADLASGHDAIMFNVANATPGDITDLYMCMRQLNVSGQNKMYLYSPKAGFSSSTGSVDVAANTSYVWTMQYNRNTTSYLRIYSLTTGLQVGSTVTLAAPNNAAASANYGTYGTITAEAAGVHFDLDNVVADAGIGVGSTQYFPLIPFEIP